jgi:ferric-dicitrate binding protein FerR (iron transport regulator)
MEMMNKETLLLKWLNNDLNDQELEAFKKLEDYDDLIQLNDGLQAFKAKDYNTSDELERILQTIKSNKKQSINWLKPFIRIASILIICLGLYYSSTFIDTKITTDFAQKTTIELPDTSSVLLNAKSFLVYNKSHWKKERELTLEGEAFFKVTKGSSFQVHTKSGTITVYGTQFNVKQRDNYFEVICYEGLVGVTFNAHETKLKPGDSFLIIDGKELSKEKEYDTAPSWINNESSFKSIPYKEVVAEFERQYNVKLQLQNVDEKQLFTGSFTHTNLDLALKSISLPLNATYTKINHTIILKRG